MATPLGHGLLGVLVHAATARDRRELVDVHRAALLCAWAMAPDLDLVAGLIDGHPNHQGPSHSLGAALLAGAVIAVGMRLLRGRWHWRLASVAALAWFSHGIMDFVSQDTRPPLGPELFWPLSTGHFIAPFSVFLYTRRTLEWSSVSHNAVEALREALILVPLVLLVVAVRHLEWGRWRDGPWFRRQRR
jgi:membrane-bound metal-dependent hydrolase YbcI (DUF457 family)